MDRFDFIKEALEDMNDSDLYNVYYNYCEANNYVNSDGMIWHMHMFDEFYCGKTPLEIAQMIEGEDFRASDKYFKETCYGVESFDWIDDEIDLDDLAEYIDRTDNDFGTGILNDFEDEYGTEEDEEN